MRALSSVLTFLVAVGAGLGYAGGVGRIFVYLEGADYQQALSMLMLFWPSEVKTWLLYAGLTFAVGPLLFWLVLCRRLPSEQLPGSVKTLAISFLLPPAVFMGVAYLTIPLSWFEPELAGGVFLGLSFLTTVLLVRGLLLRRASLETFRVAKYLAWAYLPLPLALSLIGPI